ncbi:hypothetical protein EON65_04875 [archaeon]|nr:MAG: hypothetical protein EON65_04875 [archaeon]
MTSVLKVYLFSLFLPINQDMPNNSPCAWNSQWAGGGLVWDVEYTNLPKSASSECLPRCTPSIAPTDCRPYAPSRS